MLNTLTLVINKATANVLYFETLQKSEAYIEPDDAHLYSVFSAEGKVIDVLVEKRWPLLWRFKLNLVTRLQESEKLHQEQLKAALLKHLSKIEHQQNTDDSLPLNSLVQILTETQPHGRITIKMQQLINEAHVLFSHYTRGEMSNNCDPECCPNTEVNTSLRLPIQDIPDEHLWLYYTGGPCQKGETEDFKYFLPTLAHRVAEEPSYWDPYFISEHTDLCLDEWTDEERLWLIRYFEELGKSEKYKKLCDKTMSSLMTEKEIAERNLYS